MAAVAPSPPIWIFFASAIPFVGQYVQLSCDTESYLASNLIRSVLTIALLVTAVVFPIFSFLIIPFCIVQLAVSLSSGVIRFYRERQILPFALSILANGLMGLSYCVIRAVPFVAIALEGIYFLHTFIIWLLSKKTEKPEPHLQHVTEVERAQFLGDKDSLAAFLSAPSEEQYRQQKENPVFQGQLADFAQQLYRERAPLVKVCWEKFQALHEWPEEQIAHFNILFPMLRGLLVRRGFLGGDSESDFFEILGHNYRSYVHLVDHYLDNAEENRRHVVLFKKELTMQSFLKKSLRSYLRDNLDLCANPAGKELVEHFLDDSNPNKQEKAERKLLYFQEVQEKLSKKYIINPGELFRVAGV